MVMMRNGMMRMMMMSMTMAMMMTNTKVAVVFDTMTIGLQSAIMSEGQFALTDDTRTASTYLASTILTSQSALPPNQRPSQNFVQCIIFPRTILNIKGVKALGGVVLACISILRNLP